MTISLTVGTNTYISLSDANTYFSKTFKASTWSALSDDNKSIALLEACKKMEQLQYIGIKQSDSQALEFPRNFGNPLTYGASEYDGTPQDVKNAQCELALYLYTNLNNKVNELRQNGIKSMSLGNESYSFVDNYNGYDINSPECLEYLNKWLQKGFKVC